MRIYYTPPIKQVTINQRLSSGQNAGQLKLWDNQNNQFGQSFNPGTTFPFYAGSQQVILADQNIISNEKYNNWNGLTDVTNHHSFIIEEQTDSLTSHFLPTYNATIQTQLIEGGNPSGTVDFMDPWLIDYPDPNYGNNLRNQGMSAPFKSVPYSLNNLGISTSYKGVFLNQAPDPNNPNVPYYSVREPLTQTINGYTGVFQNWSVSPSGSATLQQVSSNPSGYDQKAVVFNQANATVTANYKGVHISNDANAFSNNGQRKLIETKSGGVTWLHQVYTSMGHVWIEHSSDGGQTWILGNNGKPLDGSAGGKNPSIAYIYDAVNNYNYIGVVWQQPYGSTYKIMGIMFSQYAGSSSVPSYATEIRTLHTEPSDAYSVNANPNLILAGGAFGPYFVTFERKSTSGSWQPGINWLVGHIEDAGSSLSGPFGSVEANGIVSGTNSSTTNTQISKDPLADGYNQVGVNFIRQQGSPGVIYSHYLYLFKSGSYWQYSQTDDGMISYNANVNYSPSIVSLPDYIYAANWIEYEQMVYYSLNYQVRYYYGSSVQSCSINRGGGSSNSGFAVWSQNTSGNPNKSIRFDNGVPVSSSISTLSTSGKYLQTGNGAGSDLSQMYVSSFYPYSSPYYFSTSGTLGPLSKTNSDYVTGRGFEINKEEVTFRYMFDGLNVDGRNIDFADASDTADYGNVEVLNNALISEPFEINPNSKIVFVEHSGFSDSTSAVRMFGKDGYINYKVALIDDATGKEVGTIKSANLNSSNTPDLKASSYSLNTEGIAGKTVRIKITLETNLATRINNNESLSHFLQNEKIPVAVRNSRKKARHSNIMLIKSFTDKNEALTKSSYEQIKMEELNIPLSYALEQNYPNPFNPITVIKYQIPEDGLVTLKVYDILGREVKTLVNKYQATGKYEVTLDASELTSGVYICTIKVNNYSKSIKLMLVK